jgi:crotonobetainyl-CoA:carnitine CoA-transferase CaiB-like acyl-CoA transferase
VTLPTHIPAAITEVLAIADEIAHHVSATEFHEHCDDLGGEPEDCCEHDADWHAEQVDLEREKLRAALEAALATARADERAAVSRDLAAIPLSAIRDVGHQCDSYHLATRNLFVRVASTGVVPAAEDQ